MKHKLLKLAKIAVARGYKQLAKFAIEYSNEYEAEEDSPQKQLRDLQDQVMDEEINKPRFNSSPEEIAYLGRQLERKQRQEEQKKTVVEEINFKPDTTIIDLYPPLYTGQIIKLPNQKYIWFLTDENVGATLDGLKGPDKKPMQFNTLNEARQTLRLYHAQVVKSDKADSNEQLNKAMAAGFVCAQCGKPLGSGSKRGFSDEKSSFEPEDADWFCSLEHFEDWQDETGKSYF